MEGARSVIVPQALRTFGQVSRTIRAFRNMETGQHDWGEQVQEIHSALETILAEVPELSIDIQPDALMWAGVPILEAPEPSGSIPFALHRDGMRQLTLRQGLGPHETEALLHVLGNAAKGADAVCGLWRLELNHIDYIAGDRDEIPDFGDLDGDGQLQDAIGTVMSQVAGEAALDSEEGPLPIDQITPELFPARGLSEAPAYLDEILKEIAEEGEIAIAYRGLDGTLRALSEHLPEHEVMGLGDALLRMLDSALQSHKLDLAARIVRGVRGARQTRSFIGWWLEEATKPERLHHLTTVCRSKDQADQHGVVIDLFRAFGPWVVGAVLDLIPIVPMESLRRRLSDVVTEIGVSDLAPIRGMLASNQLALSQEAVYLLSRIGTKESWDVLDEIRHHPDLRLRAALAEYAFNLPRDRGQDIATHLLSDEEPKVQLLAMRTLARLGGPGVFSLLDRVIRQEALNQMSPELKKVAFESYAKVGQDQAVSLLGEYIQKGEGARVGRETEETALAAAWSLAYIRTVTAVEMLKQTAQSRNRRLKDTAKRALHYMKGSV